MDNKMRIVASRIPRRICRLSGKSAKEKMFNVPDRSSSKSISECHDADHCWRVPTKLRPAGVAADAHSRKEPVSAGWPTFLRNVRLAPAPPARLLFSPLRSLYILGSALPRRELNAFKGEGTRTGRDRAGGWMDGCSGIFLSCENATPIRGNEGQFASIIHGL